MKKYILFLLLILVVVADVFLVNTVKVNRDLNIEFANSGYILKYTEASERYYFEENATYRESYDEKVVFEDTEGEKVVVDKNNFIHYGDGSISSFTKGVLINLDEIEADPITYYNFSANKVLKKLSNKRYIAKNLDKELEFTNLIWKISDTKYLVVGTPLKIIFADETEKEIEGYLEIEYTDNEIVKIYNQEVKYETISTDVYMQIGENVKINLGTKIVAKNDVNEMSLENMVIDSNDNVNIVNLEEYKEDEEKENEKESENEENQNEDTVIQGGNSSSTSGGNISANGGTVGVGGTGGNTGGNIENNNQNPGGNIETEIEDTTSIITPKYTVTEFKVSSTGLQAIVEIEDEEARLSSGTITQILNNATGKVVYSLPETEEVQIKLDTYSLEPNTEYTLVMQAHYKVDSTEYKNNFIYKIFRTPIFGITLEKDMFTENSLSFDLSFDADSTVSKLDVELVGTEQVKKEIINNGGSTEKIQFENLTPDTEYTVEIKNVYIGNTSNINTYSYTFKTLKSVPKLEDDIIKVEIDKWASKFVLTIPGLEQNIVESLNYKIYTVEAEGQETLVYNKITTDTSITLDINETIQRNTDYYCRVYATFFDNEKVIEYNIAHTQTSFNMNSSEMPSIRFDEGGENGVKFNTIQGTIVIEDEGNTVDPNEKIEVRYSSTTENINDQGTLTFNGVESTKNGKEKAIPINLIDLKANETYKFAVYATYNLHDGNENRFGYIGSIMVTTPEPSPLRAVWSKGTEEGLDLSLKLENTDGSDVEAQSLYSFKLTLYPGEMNASNTEIAKATLQDEGINGFAASLKEDYYDKKGIITASNTFGLSESEVEEIVRETKKCTIWLTNAQDYVQGKNFINEIPIENHVFTYNTAKTQIKNPVNSENAIKVDLLKKGNITNETYESYDKVIRATKDENIEKSVLDEIALNSKINNDTTVGISIYANISSEMLNEYKYFEYFVYDNNGKLVAESGVIESNSGENAPKALFLVANGTDNNTTDNLDDYTGLIRGNTYYYTYYAYTNIDESGNYIGKYPENESGIDYWEKNQRPKVTIQKQLANIVMYPSISTETALTYKYKVIDLDNTIYVEEDGKRYFYHYYAGNAIFEGNKQVVNIGENNNDENGFWTVTFDLSKITEKNYNLEVNVLESSEKGKQQVATDLVKQKNEAFVTVENPTFDFSQKTGINTTISFNKLNNDVKEKITKIQIDLINGNSKITIEKNKKELETLGWNLNINYLDLIKEKGELVIGKNFDVKIKIYYINGEAGYDAIEEDDFVTYQTVNGEWLQILQNSKEFIKVAEDDTEYQKVYNLNKYQFANGKVLIQQEGNEVAWLNYSEKGLTRAIDSSGENVSILPKKVVAYESSIYEGEVNLSNVIPGIQPSAKDLEIITTPSNATIEIKRLYTTGTIYGTLQDKSVFAKVYKYDYDNDDTNDENIGTYKIVMDENKQGSVEVNNLENQTEYYCKLYVKNGQDEIYLYDFDNKIEGVKYRFNLIDKVEIEDIKVAFSKSSITEGSLTIEHSASVKNGFIGFKYQICDENGVIEKGIEYKINKYDEYISSTTGEFNVDLENYSNEEFKVIVKADRNSFFEYDKEYYIRITPIISNEEGETEQMKEVQYSYIPEKPVMLLYSRRVEAANGEESYMEWSISVSDQDYLITEDGFEYEIYKNGNETPLKERTKIDLYNDYATIRLDGAYDDQFDFESKYTLKIYYSYYKNNQANEIIPVVKTKEIKKLQSGVDIGNISWKIEDSAQIKLKFYDSYDLSKVKSMRCSIYDTSGTILNKVQEISNIEIIEQNENINDIHKSITFTTNYTFETSKAYKIIIQFYGEDGNLITTFEPENPETYNQGV